MAKGLTKELNGADWQNETHPNDEKRRLSMESMDVAQMETQKLANFCQKWPKLRRRNVPGKCENVAKMFEFVGK
jgi:hypothetical protein